MATLTELGFERPTYAELLETQIALAKTLFGEDIETSDLTALGKYIRLNVFEMSKLYEELESVYYARFPNTATGQSLDRLCVFAGITRNPATQAIHTAIITGEAGAVIEAGDLLIGTNDNVTFYLINSVTLTSTTIDGETVGIGTGTFACTEYGTVGNVAVGTINKIMQPNLNVSSVEHTAITTLAVDNESDVALRKRFNQTISGAGSGTIDSIYGEIMRVANVTGCMIAENNTSETDIDGRPPNSYECYVLGGTDTDIANAIFNKSPIGIKTVGDITVPIEDKGAYLHDVKFSRTVEKPIYINISIKVNSYFETTGTAEIKNNLITFMASLVNGEDVILSSLYSKIHSVAGVVETSLLELSTDGETYTAANVICANNEVARSSTDKIEIEVTDYVDN